MIAQISATVSRTACEAELSHEVESEPRAVSWAARLVQISLAIYLIPVILVMFLVGGIGIAVAGVVVFAAKLAAWSHHALRTEEESPFPS